MALMKEPLFDTSDALCFGEDPEIFMPEGPDHVRITRQAKSICASCPIAKTCLEYAIRNNEWGIWGGSTMKERVVLKRRPATGVDEYLKMLVESKGRRDFIPLTDENTISI